MAYEIPHGRTLETDFMFTKLLVNDLEKSAAFYSTVIGLIEMNRMEAEITGRKITEIVYMATYEGGPMFILGKFHDAPKPVNDEVILGFGTKDMGALLERAEKAGVSLAEPLREDPNMGFRTAYLFDPEGHLVQISQPLG